MAELPGQLALRYAGLKVRRETPHGQVYGGRSFAGAEVSVAVLNEQAAADPATRETFAELVRELRHSAGAGGSAVHSQDLTAARPWAAIHDEQAAERLLAALTGSAPPPPPAAAPAAAVAPAPALAPAPPPAAAVPPAPAPATPPGGQSAAPASSATKPFPNRRLWLNAWIVAVMVLGAVLLSTMFRDTGEPAPASDPAGAAPEPPVATMPVPERTSEATALGPDPQLRSVPQISLLGPVWQAGDETVTWAFPGWPFAFRTPPDWVCLPGSFEPIPAADAWQCTDATDPSSGRRVGVLLWECPTNCTGAEQSQMVESWLDEPERALLADPHVWYVETEENRRGNYAVDLSAFVADPDDPAGELRWHLGVYLESPAETADELLKVLNDILSQSS